MSGNDFQIIFEGKLLEGHSLDTVKKNISSLFKMSEEQVEKIFTGDPVIIKKNTDEQTALKYQTAFRKAGAECQIHNETATTHAPSEQATPRATPTKTESSNTNAPRMIYSTRDVVNLAVPKDLSALSMAAPGAILSKAEAAPAFKVDLSELVLAELESGYLVEAQTVKPQKIEELTGVKLEPL